MADRKCVKESDIPLEVLYNTKIERIRAIEHQAFKPPEPIRFTVLESVKENKNTHRLVKLECLSAPKVYEFEINVKEQPIFVESHSENFNRNNREEFLRKEREKE